MPPEGGRGDFYAGLRPKPRDRSWNAPARSVPATKRGGPGCTGEQRPVAGGRRSDEKNSPPLPRGRQFLYPAVVGVGEGDGVGEGEGSAVGVCVAVVSEGVGVGETDGVGVGTGSR